MWQRIQTLYMLVSLVLLGLAIAYSSNLYFIILLSVGAAANLVPLFCFKHRMLQMRLLVFGAVELLLLQGWMAWDYFTAGAGRAFNYSTIVPLIVVILDFLAIRGVMQDELVVRSSSRLRASRRERRGKSKKNQ